MKANSLEHKWLSTIITNGDLATYCMELMERDENLLQVMLKYGNHLPICSVHTRPDTCNCGWTDMLVNYSKGV